MIEQHTDEWHEQRRTGIGGSDIAALVDQNPWTNARDVYLQKVGLVGPAEETPDMRRGTMLQEIAAGEYAIATGRELVVPELRYQHKKHPWAQGEVDKLVAADGHNSIGVLEIKVPRSWTYEQMKWQGLQPYIVLQGQWYLAVTGYEWVSFWIFNADAWEGFFVDRARNDELIAEMLLVGSRFWECVEANAGPPGQMGMDIAVPAVRQKDVILNESAEWVSAINQYKVAKEIEGETKALVADSKDRIIKLMGEAERMEGAGARVYYEHQSRIGLDKKAMKADGIDVAKYETATHSRPLKIFLPKGETK